MQHLHSHNYCLSPHRVGMFSTQLALAALFLIATSTAQEVVAPPAAEDASLHVTLFYESLCPDSMSFISDELFPTWLLLREYFSTHLVPYGKATHGKNSDSSYWFRCQHGARECKGNMVQACAIHVINDPALEMRWVDCVMRSPAPHRAGPTCSASLNVDYAPIRTCSEGLEGQKFLAEYGDETHALRPALSFVPTVTFNGTYNSDLQQRSLSSFKAVVCELLSAAQQSPSACS